MKYNKQIKKGFSLGWFLIFLIFVGLGLWAYSKYDSPMFEKNKPLISIKKSIYWNSNKTLEVHISDDTGLKQAKVYLSDGKNIVKIIDKNFKKAKKDHTLKIIYPTLGLDSQNGYLKLIIEVTDISKWNFFSGNSNKSNSIILVDNQKPDLFSLITSYGITKGGVGLAIFKAKDKNLNQLYIETNFGKKFYPTKFYKDDYYIALLAWPIKEKKFRAKVIAIDKAGNKSQVKLDFNLKNKNYRTSYIEAKDRFINGKIAYLCEDKPDETASLLPTEKLDFVNRIYREENNILIKKITSKIDTNKISNFNFKAIYPLKNAKAVGSHGDHRYYYYKEKKNIISEAYHLGLDLASIKRDDILMTNAGVCVYANYNGIYGSNLIVYHGLGLYTLYAHCSTIFVKKGDLLKAGEVVAKTGTTGLALGDHLHLSILVQGIFVRPAEWMDSKWIKANITDVISDAKRMIDK